MTINLHTDYERLRELSSLAQIGWWEANFTTEQYFFSEVLCQILGLRQEVLRFDEMYQMIRKDYRNRIMREFSSIVQLNAYDQTFPICNAQGEELWLRSHMGFKETQANQDIVAFGYAQRVEAPDKENSMNILNRINEQLSRQNSITHSLTHFVQDKSPNQGIVDILTDILLFFQGGRAYIFEYDKELMHQSCTFEVVADGVAPEKETLQQISTQSLPWWTKQVLEQKAIILNKLVNLPTQAQAEYEILHRQDIKSLMVIPLAVGDKVWGYIGVDLVDQYREWTNDDYQWLASLANIVSICMELRRTKDVAEHERWFKLIYKFF